MPNAKNNFVNRIKIRTFWESFAFSVGSLGVISFFGKSVKELL